MEKTYKGWEIAKMISEGELKDGTVINSEGSNFTVLYGCLTDGFNEKYSQHLESGNSFLTSTRRTFSIERKKYSFAEAFKAYEEGKEIESRYGGQKLKKENEKDYCFDYEKGKYVPLSFDETFFDITNIRSEWYIND